MFLYHKSIRHILTFLICSATVLAVIGHCGDPFFDLLAGAPAIIFFVNLFATLLLLDIAWDIASYVIRLRFRRTSLIKDALHSFADRTDDHCDCTPSSFPTGICAVILAYVYGFGISWVLLFGFLLTYAASVLRMALYELHCDLARATMRKAHELKQAANQQPS
jgi:hypothetical protein